MSNSRAIATVTKRIRGAGGEDDSSSAPRVPTQASDTIQTVAYIRVVDLICEGEIEGLVDGAKSIFLDETRLQNLDGSYNFSNISVDTRTGTQIQDYLQNFGFIENEINLVVALKYAEPVIREINDANIDRLKVRLQFNGLQSTDVSSGDVSGGSVRITVWLQPSGGSYAKVADRTVSGKSSGQFEIQLAFPLDGAGPWNLKVVRETPDSHSVYIVDAVTVASYTEVIDQKLRYPNSALVAMRVDATQFQSVPTRYYEMKGLKVRIPSNYDPVARTYSGSWDGTFQTAYSNNPAWCFYDLLTSERYGLGGFIPAANVDRWSLYAIGRYCDELISDGFGGLEPRFTCNLLLQSRQEAYTVLQNMASIFRGMIYWAAGLVTVSQDSPADPVALYTPANVIDGAFAYQGASAKARHTVALVSWNDPLDFYRQKVEYVEDRDGILELGVNETQIVAFGCTSRSQAHRLGKWLLYTERHEAETIAFKTGLEGLVCRPGQIIQVADPTRAGARMGGRIAAATALVITVDQIPSGLIVGGELLAVLPDKSVEKKIIDSISGNTITLAEAFSTAPSVGAVWMIRSNAIEPQNFRVLAIKEDDHAIFAITAISSDPDKFAFVEEDIALEPRSYTGLKIAPASPTNIVISEALYVSGAQVKNKLSVSWERAVGAVSYIIRYRRDDDNWIQLPETAATDYTFPDAQPGVYTFDIIALNSIGRRSIPAEASKQVFGKTALPENVQNFSMLPVAGGTMAGLTWTQAVDLDVLIGGTVEIRWTPLLVGQLWGNAIRVGDAIPGSATSAQVPLLAGTYMAKFLSASGFYSADESLIETTVPEALALNVIETIEEDPTFPGVKSAFDLSPTENAIFLSSRYNIDDIPDMDGLLEPIDFAGGASAFGSYKFQNTFDLGGVYASNLTASVQIEAFDLATIIDSRYDNIDDWQDLDGDTIDDIIVELYVRSTNDDPSGSPTWTPWKRFVAAQYSARAFQFQLLASSPTPTHNVYIRALSVVIDMPDRVVEFDGLVSGTGASYHVTYPEPYRVAPAVAITGNAMSTGDFYTITGADETGFDIVFKNSGSTIVSRNFNVVAKGYGRKVA